MEAAEEAMALLPAALAAMELNGILRMVQEAEAVAQETLRLLETTVLMAAYTAAAAAAAGLAAQANKE